MLEYKCNKNDIEWYLLDESSKGESIRDARRSKCKNFSKIPSSKTSKVVEFNKAQKTFKVFELNREIFNWEGKDSTDHNGKVSEYCVPLRLIFS